jgi:regulatory protein
MSNVLYNQALNRAMKLCSKEEKCTYDIRIKLHQWGIAENDAEKIIARLVKEDFINEKRYAESFVRSKLNQKKWGKIKINYALQQKQINQNTIISALNMIPFNHYQETITAELRKKLQSVKQTNLYKTRVQLFRFGKSRGYETNMINQALDTILK